MAISNQLKDRIRLLLYSPRFFRDYFFCKIRFGYWDNSWRFLGLPIVQKHSSAKILIGKKFIACSDPKKNSIGVFQRVIIKALAPGGKIEIGDNVGISGATISGKNIKIGNNVLIGSGAVITDTDAHPINPNRRSDSRYILSSPVVIEDDVFIGARSIILKGVVLGKGCVVGAGSVVVKNVSEMQIVAGNPAKVIGDVRDPRFDNKITL